MAAELRHPTRIATLSALLVVSAYVAAKAGRDAILLSRFSIESLPLFIGLSAAVSLPIILLAGRLMVRFGPARLIPVMNGLSGLLLLGEWLLIGSYPRPIAVLVFFHLSTASAVLVSGFWSIVNERFDIQSAKRNIGRIGLGATIGGILGGVIAERSSVYFERDAILLVIGALQLACAVGLLVFGGGAAPRAVPASDEPKPKMWSSLGIVAHSRLLRGIGAIVVLTAILAGILDYVFKADIVAGGSKTDLLHALAVFYTITNVVTAVIQVAVCGPIISKLGVPRSVATLPITVTAFSLLAAVVRVPLASALARASELVTRNSVYRAGYELLYAPLPEQQKRPTKVIIDVGADKVGDIIGAQIVAAVLWLAIDDRTGLLTAALVVGALALVSALRLPRAYSKALEESLMTYAAAAEAEASGEPPDPEPWLSLSGVPSFGGPGEAVPLRLRSRSPKKPVPEMPPPTTGKDPLVELVRDLRSSDPARVKRALTPPVPLELASHVVLLIGDDAVAREACAALVTLVPRCTGMVVDAMLDPSRDAVLRRRLPAVLAHGEPRLAVWGLWRGLADPSFDVRYRAGIAISRLAGEGHVVEIRPEDVYETVRREIGGEISEWKQRQLADDIVASGEDDDDDDHSATALAHVFRVLGLVLPSEPLRIALRALQTDDTSLRGMALEYVESILPPDVRAQLWPLLDHADGGAAGAVSATVSPPPDEHAAVAPSPRRSKDELLEQLKLSYPTVVERLKRRAAPG